MAVVRYDVDRDEPVRDANGHCIACAPGEVGEAIGKISSVGRFEGYTDAEASEKKILRNVFADGDAYFRTGDLLRFDENDDFYFVDRIGDTFRWKGENVATSEVAEALTGAPGVEDANVYGVGVPGQDGRAGMAAMVVGEDFDAVALYRHVADELPTYARPLFLRLRSEMETTGTFKHRKVDLVREGFDPHAIEDRLLFRDDGAGAYVSLDRETYEAILSGTIRV
jgi:fatty-acyl-CoA synthase